jgi:hypothetical protein
MVKRIEDKGNVYYTGPYSKKELDAFWDRWGGLPTVVVSSRPRNPSASAPESPQPAPAGKTRRRGRRIAGPPSQDPGISA